MKHKLPSYVSNFIEDKKSVKNERKKVKNLDKEIDDLKVDLSEIKKQIGNLTLWHEKKNDS